MSGLVLPRREISGRFAALADHIQCDHAPLIIELSKCPTPGDMAPRLLVPSKTQMVPGHEHLRVDFRDHHFCASHTGELKVEDLLDMKLRGNLEIAAKRTRPIDFKCDFEIAHIVYVSIFTPEYKYFEVVKHLMPRERLQEAWGTVVGS